MLAACFISYLDTRRQIDLDIVETNESNYRIEELVITTVLGHYANTKYPDAAFGKTGNTPQLPATPVASLNFGLYCSPSPFESLPFSKRLLTRKQKEQ